MPLLRKRHPQNPNATLNHTNHYKGLSLDGFHGPYVQEYLQSIHKTLQRALKEYQEIYTLRFELHPPGIHGAARDNQRVTCFWRELKLLIARLGAGSNNTVRYVWSRERDVEGQAYWLCCILLNRLEWSSAGAFDPGDINLRWMLAEAWGRALGFGTEEANQLLVIRRGNQKYISASYPDKVAELFCALSPMCSLASTEYSGGVHPFGCSRI